MAELGFQVTKLDNFTLRFTGLKISQMKLIQDKLSHKARYIENGHYRYNRVYHDADYENKTIDVPIALMPWLNKELNLPFTFFKASTIFKISDDEAEFLSTKFEINMLEVYNELISGNPRSLVQLPTGTGKTFLLAALVKSYIGTGNILVISPSSMVRQEICDRCSTEELKLSPGFNPRQKVCVVDYAGFGRSQKIDTEAAQEWLDKVQVVLYDESETLTEGTEYAICQCRNADIFYGFSANPDPIYDACLYSVNKLSDVLDDTFNIMWYFGVAAVFRENRKDIELHIRHGNLNWDKYCHWAGNGEIAIAYKKLLAEPDLINFFYAILANIKSRGYEKGLIKDKFDNVVNFGILFSLVHTEFAQEVIGDALEQKGYRYVCWSAGQIDYSPADWSRHETIDYDTFKQYCEEGKVDAILATTVAKRGINIRQITDVAIIRDNKYGNINQIIGRVRDKVPHVWCPTFEGRALTAVTSHTRITTIKKNYNCNVDYDDIPIFIS